MIEVVDAVRDLLEPPDGIDGDVSVNGVNIDRSASAPIEPAANTIYAWEVSRQERSIGAGEIRQNFGVDLLFVLDNGGELPQGQRERDVSEALDVKASAYLRLIRLFANIPPWASGNIEGASDADSVRALSLRGVGIHVTGYRLVTE